jgi:hypothetical protein
VFEVNPIPTNANMEQAVLSIFQEQLAKVIVGFRKEQVNANLLNGKGEIQDVSLNCSFLNEKIATVTPFIELKEIHVSRLGFHVTSWTNLRKAPIIVDIGHITAKVQEPLRVLPRHRRRKLEMVTEAELIHKMMTEGFKPLRGSGSYGILDRIIDNMTIEMDSLTLEYQTWGKFKTQRMGQWTPPAIQVRFEHLKVVMVDPEGNEASPDQVWHHNQHHREHFMIYKKLYGECQVRLCPNTNDCNEDDYGNERVQVFPQRSFNVDTTSSIKLVETKMEIQMAIQRRLRDGAVLAVQMDVTLPQVDAKVDSRGVYELAHFAAGLQYCFAKDRSFDDPLRSKSEDTSSISDNINATSPNPMVSRTESTDDDDDNEEDTPGEDGNRDRVDTADSAVESSSIDSVPTDCDVASVSSWQSDEDASLSRDASSHGGPSKKPVIASTKQGSSRPVIILPNGLVVYKSISITCAVHNVSFRGFYPSKTPINTEDTGCIEFNAKGCVSELIWPKADRDPGFYAQLSASFITLQERFNKRKRTILFGGMQREDHLSLLLPSRKPLEIGADEFFPLFERRGIREDPLDLRHLFPTQALGVKTTVDILKEKRASDNSSLGPHEFETKYKVLHEMGLDEMDIVLDPDIFHRMIRFFLNQDGGGFFDPRWHTGDWSELLSPGMLHHPNKVLDLDEYLQEPRQIFLDENSMISSDLFNVTARLTNVEMKIPAAVQDNLRSCDIAMKWKETTLVVSSALPRTFLSGKIGNSIAGDARKDPEKGVIDFPNDPGDICYKLDKPDVGSTFVGSNETLVSTFRAQVTLRGFEMNIIPLIPFCKALEPRQLLIISNLTMILSCEGEPPREGNNQIRITLFVSILVHDLTVNLDLDLLAGAIFTILHHRATITVIIIQATSALFPPSPTNRSTTISNLERVESNCSTGIKKSLKGRKILVQRHISQSRQTGGLGIVFCIQHHNFSLRGWRQNIPTQSPLRRIYDDVGESTRVDDGGLVGLVNLVDFNVKEFEVGVEFDFHANAGRRTVVKCSVDKATLKVCDVEKELLSQGKERCSIDLCSFGDSGMPGTIELSGNGQQIAFRIEGQHTINSHSWSMAGDITSPSRMQLHAHAVRNVALLVLEALLLPSWSKKSSSMISVSPFPQGTIGAAFQELVGRNVSREPTVSLDLANLDLEDSSDAIVERVLRAASKILLPADLQVVLLRLEVANFIVSIPSTHGEKELKSLCLLLHQADIISRFYPVRGTRSSNIESVLACKGTDWSTLINTDNDGFYQRLVSRQSLLSFCEETLAVVETVVHPFEFNLTYSCAKVDVMMSKGLQIDDIRQIESFHSRLKSAIAQSSECFSDISYVVASMKRRVEKDMPESTPDDESTKRHGNCSSTPDSIGPSRLQKARSMLERGMKELLLYEEEIRATTMRRDEELEAMKLRLFMKEKERFGVISLMASRVAGWVRMGGLHRTGQRVARKSLLWPYWTVLRKELLILYPSPGVVRINWKETTCLPIQFCSAHLLVVLVFAQNKPFDIISLVNASIKQLAGGTSKQDTKRGFAVVEVSGVTRYFIARNAQEYSLWTREIAETIRSCSDPEVVAEMSDDLINSSETEINRDGASDDYLGSASGNGRRHRGLGNRLASSIQSAKLRAKEFTDRRGRTISNDSLEDFEDDNENEQARDRVVSFDDWSQGGDQESVSRRAQIGKKLSGVGQATKSRLGSAIQSARQKGADISKRRKWHESESNDLLHGNADTKETFEDSIEASWNDGQAPRRRLQLGSKLGSAIQKAKAGGLTGFRSKLGGISPNQDDTVRDVSMCHNSTEAGNSRTTGNIQSYWSCEACTFVNSLEGSCEMCGTPRKTSLVKSLPLETESNSFEVRIMPNDPQEAPGNAAEVVPDTQSCDFHGTASIENSNRRNSRFGFRRRQEEATDDSVFGGDSVVLKNVYASNRSPTSDRGPNDATVPLKMLQGKWIVAVGITNAQITTSKPERSTEHLDQRLGSFQKIDEGEMDGVKAQCLEEQKCQQIEEHNHGNSQNGDNPSDSSVSTIIPTFDVRVFRASSLSGPPESTSQLTLGVITNLFTDLSEAVEGALPQLIDSRFYEESHQQEYSKQDVVEKVLVFGRILSGMLECDDRNEVRNYQSDLLEGFLNALLECPLPVEALLSLSETLGIAASTVDAPAQTCTIVREKIETNNVLKDCDTEPLSYDRPTTILSLLSACQSELQRIENETAIRKTNKNNDSLSVTKLPPQLTNGMCFDPILPPSLTNILHDSIHDVLLHVMAERDEAHAQLIGANVMHIHSLERERKKNEKLSAEVQMREELAKIQAKEDLNQPNLAILFGGKPDDRMAKMRKEVDLKIEAFHQVYRSHSSTEEEMTQLCTQLANEIATKTSYALEIERLKDLKRTEADERSALREELKRVKEMLAAEEKHKWEAKKEADQWKAMYESMNTRKNE